jgi:general secretion pathway protein G
LATTTVLAVPVAALLLHRIFGNTYYLRDIAAQTDLVELSSQLELYEKLNGFYPTTAQGLQALVSRPQSSPIPEHWIQQLRKNVVDPWSHPYVYRFPSTRDSNTFDLFSLGPDGIESNDDIRARLDSPYRKMQLTIKRLTHSKPKN